MSWFGQVRHVIAKDIRHSAWFIVLVLVLLGVVTAQALVEPQVPPPPNLGPVGYVLALAAAKPLLFLASALLLATLIQADSPARGDAFWVSRPLDPSAIATAKLGLATLVLLVLPLGAQLGALLTHRVPPPQIPAFLGESALRQAGLLMAAGALAALTRDLRTFALACLLVSTGWLLGAGITRASLGQPTMWPPADSLSVQSFVWLLSGLAVLSFQYRVRDVGRTVKVFAAPVGIAAVLATALPGGGFARGSRSTVPEDLRASDVRVWLNDVKPVTGGGEGGTQWVHLQINLADADAAHRYALVEGSVTVPLPDGSDFRAPLMEQWGELSSVQIAPSHADWLLGPKSPPFGPTPSQAALMASLTVPERVADAISSGSARLILDGRMEVLASRVFGQVPLRAGEEVTRDGRRFRVMGMGTHGAQPMVGAAIDWVGLRDPGSFPRPETYDSNLSFIAVNPTRREALLLHRTGSGAQGHSLVLPGPEVFIRTLNLETLEGFRLPSLGVGEDWWRDAELEIGEWTPIGGYPLHAEIDEVALAPRLRLTPH